MQTKIIKIATFSFCFILTSCGITTPFVDARREAGKNQTVGESTIDTAVICYNSFSLKPDKLKKMADEECNKTNRIAKFKMQKSFSCTFFQPTRAYFSCIEDSLKDEPFDENVFSDEPNISIEEPLIKESEEFIFHNDDTRFNEEVYFNENSTF